MFQLKKGDRVAYEGVKVTAKGNGGFSGSATSDKNGRWTIPVPRPGRYTVTIDTKSLPKGVNLTDSSKESLKVPVLFGQQKPVLFPLGKSTRVVESKWSQAVQLTAEGFRFGLIIALAAVGLSLIFGTTGLTNFAHGELVTIGALMTFWISTGNLPLLPDFGGLQFFPAAAIALVLCGVIGWLNDAVLWRPLRRRGTGLIAAHDRLDRPGHLPAVLLPVPVHREHPAVPRLPRADGHRHRPAGPGRRRLHLDGRRRRRPARDASSRCSAPGSARPPARCPTTPRWRRRPASTSTGSSASSGSSARRSPAWPASCSASTQGVNFQMGFQILLLIFAAVTLGGLGTAYGALVGSLVVGLFIEVSTLWIPTSSRTSARSSS